MATYDKFKSVINWDNQVTRITVSWLAFAGALALSETPLIVWLFFTVARVLPRASHASRIALD